MYYGCGHIPDMVNDTFDGVNVTFEDSNMITADSSYSVILSSTIETVTLIVVMEGSVVLTMRFDGTR